MVKLKILSLLIGLLLGHNSFAQAFTFDHSDCVLRYKTYEGKKQVTLKQALGLLKERNYDIKPMLDNKRLLARELYFVLDVERPNKKVFTSCIVKVAIKSAKGTIPSERDRSFTKRL